jgi:hypothetical protein
MSVEANNILIIIQTSGAVVCFFTWIMARLNCDGNYQPAKLVIITALILLPQVIVNALLKYGFSRSSFCRIDTLGSANLPKSKAFKSRSAREPEFVDIDSQSGV